MKKWLLIITFLIAASSSFAAFSQTKSAALANCATTYATHAPSYWSPWVCVTVPNLYAGTVNETGSVYIGTAQSPTAGAAFFNQSYIGFQTCTSPQVINYTTGACEAPAIVACPSGQYAPLGSTSTASCVAVPNCNASSPTDGKYFDINTAACVTQTTNLTVCLEGVAVAGGSSPSPNYYCPPVSDCQAASKACSNNAINVSTAQAARAAEVAAIKAIADAKKAQADTAASSAAASKTAKDNAKAAALAAQTAAKTNSDSVTANTASTPLQISQALTAYSQAAADYTTAAIKAANSALASIASSLAASNAATHTNAIPSANTGNATTLGDYVSNDLAAAVGSSVDAATGQGTGQGANNGASQGTLPTGMATETTLQAINGKLVKDTTALSSGIDSSVRTIAASNTALNNAFRSHIPNLNFSAITAECPTWTRHIPLLNVDLTIDQFCTMEQYIKPFIQDTMAFVWPMTALFIIFGA